MGGFIDDIAERIRCLDHYTPAMLMDFLKLASKKNEVLRQRSVIKELILNHEGIIIEEIFK